MSKHAERPPTTTYRLNAADRTVIDELARAMGVTRTDVVRIAVRDLARRRRTTARRDDSTG